MSISWWDKWKGIKEEEIIHMILISYGDKSTKNRNGQNAKIKQTTKEK